MSETTCKQFGCSPCQAVHDRPVWSSPPSLHPGVGDRPRRGHGGEHRWRRPISHTALRLVLLAAVSSLLPATGGRSQDSAPRKAISAKLLSVEATATIAKRLTSAGFKKAELPNLTTALTDMKMLRGERGMEHLLMMFERTKSVTRNQFAESSVTVAARVRLLRLQAQAHI